MTQSDTGPLCGSRVVELGTGIESAFGSRVLADMGADVVKVEPTTGDPLRLLGLGPGTSVGQAHALFEYLNWNKSSVALDDGAADDVVALIESADIVVQRRGRFDASSYGVDLATARQRCPALVVVSVSDFGAEGPYADRKADDLLLHALSGIMQISGTSDRAPLKPGLRQSRYGAGLNVVYTALAARLMAIRTGSGAAVDLSVLECLASQLVLNEAHYAFLGAVQGRRPRIQDPLAGESLPSADGWLSLQTSGLLSVDRLANLFDDERFGEERFATSERRTEHAKELQAILVEHLGTRKSAEFFVEASSSGYLTGFVQSASDLLNCAHLRARGVFHTIDTPETGRARVDFPAVLASFSRTPTSVRSPAPAVGQHTDAVLAGVRHRRVAPHHNRAASRGHGPLSGMRVLDLSTVFAVPYMGALMADLGADVLKVEAPGRLDQTRTLFGRPYFNNDPDTDWWNRSATFQVVNRGKRSLTLDLGTTRGRELLIRLVGECDVLLDNFTPRVLPKWGLTYNRLRQENPRLVMLSNTGYGSSGPWSAFRAQGTTLEATMGLTEHTGYADGPPSKFGQSYPDFLACWAGLGAIMAALIDRESTGHGQWIDLGMYQLGPAVIPEALIAAQVPGVRVGRMGNHDLDAQFSDVFESAEPDRWVAVSVHDEQHLAALASLVRSPSATADVLSENVSTWCRRRSRHRAVTELLAAGIPSAPVNDARDLLCDPQLRFRRFYEWIDVGDLGPRPVIGRPFLWETTSASPGSTATSPAWRPAVRGPGPRFGEANREVLGGELGLGPAALAELERSGVIACRPAQYTQPHPAIDVPAMLASGEFRSYEPDYAAELVALCEPTNPAASDDQTMTRR
jgi:crotonobetainyl-CoA:carnitine CoA-transferase CaiB-like acyl-CoA transferase